MDLKGSLVDTNLRIYPTEKLIAYLKTLTLKDDIPHNILEIIKGNSNFKSYGSDNLKPVYLTSTETDKLKNIKEMYPDVVPLTTETKVGLTDSNVMNKNNEEKFDKHNKKQDRKKGEIENEPKEKSSEKDEDSQNEKNSEKSKDSKEDKEKMFLVTADIDWLYENLKLSRSKNKDIPYIHTLLDGVQIDVPKNEIIKRNPVLEARCVKLRAQQEAREYRKMTKGVDNVRIKFPEDSISYQLKQLNRQLIAIGQFIISIFAGFLFGFRGVEWMVGNLDFGFRLLLGVMCALVIALAEIYFLAKKLNEELNIPETVQLGGPLKFADQKNYPSPPTNSTIKQHQD